MSTGSIVKYFLVWQAVIILITLVSLRLLPLQETYIGGATQTYRQNPLLYSRANFDGNHYISIAQNGYGYAQQAFFPFYPNLIRLATPVVKNPASAGVVISLASFFPALVILNKLISLDYPRAVARWTILALLIFPTSFFFTSVYTEGLFFLLLISSFYFARTRRWWLAGVCAALAANTRFVGIFIFPALLIEWWQAKATVRSLLPLLFIPLGLLAYMFYLSRTTGDPLAFFHVQASFGQFRSERVILLHQVFWRYTKMLATVDRNNPLYLTIVLEVLTGILFLVTSVYAFIKGRLSYGVFNALAYLVPTFTGSFVSLPRYVLVCFPSFILIGRYLAGSYSRHRLLIFLGLGTLMFIFLSLFSRGYWVA